MITEQLIAEQLVTEGAQGNLPRGRKPTFLHLNSSRIVVIGVAISPGETTLVVADLAFNFLIRDSMQMRGEAHQFVAELSQRIRSIKAAAPQLTFAGVGITLPGRVDPASGQVVFAPSLPWSLSDLKVSLAEAVGIPVEIENSANACVLAELWSGRYPETVQNMIAVVVADGVEVGMLMDGQLVRGAGGLAGEFGHVTVQEHGPACRCGNRGCLAVCGSNAAAVRVYAEQTPAAAAISFAAIRKQADRGERAAVQALQRMAQCLGRGIVMLVAGLSPDVILLAGELTDSWRLIGPVIDQVLAQQLPAGFRNPGGARGR
ncbi:MAG: ROK family protein [Verrucomicrobiota bacterium]